MTEVRMFKTKPEAEMGAKLFNVGLKVQHTAALAVEMDGVHAVGVESTRQAFEVYLTVEELAERLRQEILISST